MCSCGCMCKNHADICLLCVRMCVRMNVCTSTGIYNLHRYVVIIMYVCMYVCMYVGVYVNPCIKLPQRFVTEVCK